MSGKNEAVVIALACQIVKLRDRVRIWKQTALTLENEAKSARADAVARTEADRKRIAGLTEELRLERETCTETADLLNRESEKVRGLSVQAQDQRAEIERLKAQTPIQHPAKVGAWVRRTDEGYPDAPTGYMAQVLSVTYRVRDQGGSVVFWYSSFCEPCDPPEADHDTEAGKAAAEAALKTEIKVGDVVEVVSNTGLNTWLADVGSFGTVASVETIMDLSVRLAAIPGKKNALGGYVSLCDVRKVTT